LAIVISLKYCHQGSILFEIHPFIPTTMAAHPSNRFSVSIELLEDGASELMGLWPEPGDPV
jgi:hypothetical protein